MQIYIGIRGPVASIKKWVNFMSSQYLPFEVLEKKKNGKMKKKPTPYLAQLVVREIKMYEIVFPKESEAVVMGMIKPSNGYGGMNRLLTPFRAMLRLIGVKKCSTNWKPNILPPNEGLTIVALGKKEDKLNWEKKKDANQCLLDGHIPKENL